ncbi:hypothetical protein XENOCAPTIV_029023, partial [Xenoophorus captivus]
GKNFVGDLLNDGKIRWVETGQIFNSPSAWATHCKRLVNPAKKSGCGWASVRYRGQKLAQYKTTWLHKYQPSADMLGLHHHKQRLSVLVLTVLRAFPCRTRLADRDTASAVEEEICQNLFMRGLSLVGWYHSHPRGPALPSLQDIDSQMDHQLRLQGSNNGFQPCLGIICG